MVNENEDNNDGTHNGYIPNAQYTNIPEFGTPLFYDYERGLSSGSPVKKKKEHGFLGILSIILAVSLVVVLAIGQGSVIHKSQTTTNTTSLGPVVTPNTNKISAADYMTLNAVSAKTIKSMIDVNITIGYRQATAAGTGIIISSNGLILTNNHVINGATTISGVTIDNGNTYPATVVGYDKTQDVAVIKLTGASGLVPANLGNSSNLAVGQPVIGVGNAGGVGGAPTSASGTITALNRSIVASDSSQGSSENLAGLIQTDAAIRPGDSGGPLVNLAGRVIAMNTATSTSTKASALVSPSTNQGFSIPINQALTIAHSIIAGHGTNLIHIGPTGFLGIQVSPTSNVITPNSGGSIVGVPVIGVVSGTPAADFGITAGDIITSINGMSVSTSTALTEILYSLHPGDKVALVWTNKSGKITKATIALGVGPSV